MSTLTSPSFVEHWRHAGLSDTLPELIEAYSATRARIESERKAAVEATRQARADRAEFIAAGRGGTFPALPDQVDFDAAQRVAEKAFRRQLGELGDSLILDELAPAHAELMAEAAELVPLIGRLTSDAMAVDRHTTPEAREAWSALGGLWRSRKALLELFLELRLSDVVNDAKLPAEQRALSEYRLFARPARGNGSSWHPSQANPPDPVLMAGLVRDARQTRPGIYTLDEARAHRAAVDEAEWQESRLRSGGSTVTDPHRAKAVDATLERERARVAAEDAEFRGELANARAREVITAARQQGLESASADVDRRLQTLTRQQIASALKPTRSRK